MDTTEKRRRFIINALYWAILAALIIFFIRNFLNVLTPFVIAFLVSALLRPLWSWLVRRFRLPRRLTAILTVLLFYLAVGILLVLLANSLFSLVKSFAAGIPGLYTDTIEPGLTNLAASIKALGDNLLGPSYDVVVNELMNSIAGLVSTLSGRLLGWATTLISDIPSIMLNILISVIATIFASADWGHIRAFLRAQLPEKQAETLLKVRQHFGKVMRSYARSYAIIMGITFMEVFLGTLLLGYNSALLIGAGVAVFDILPILGSGMILVPWGIVTLFGGNLTQGLGLIILYLIIAAVRNYIEPRIVGKHVGLHPLVTLMSMVIGTYIFGGIGLFGLPIALAVLQSLREAGILKLYKDPAPDDA